MNELLRHQSSRAYYDRHHSGCVWGLFRLFHPRSQSRKTLSYSRRSNEELGNYARKSKEQSPIKEENNKMEDQGNEAKKSSTMTGMLSLLYNKIRRKRDRKPKKLVSSSQLIRTLSIHHLECNDYMVHSEMATAREFKKGDMELSSDSPAKSNAGQVRWNSLKNSLKDVIEESNKNKFRISMDGILHKVPSGSNLPEYIEKEKLKLEANGSVFGNAKFENRTIQRSRSLVESLDRYSPLLESISFKEPKRVPEKLMSLKDDNIDIAKRRVLRSQSFTDAAYKDSHLLKSKSVREIRRLESVRDGRSMKTFGRLLSNPEMLANVYKVIGSNESLEFQDSYVSDDAKKSRNIAATIQDTDETMDVLEKMVSTNEQDQNETCRVVEDHELSVAENPSPNFVQVAHIEDEPVSSSEYEVIEGAEPVNLTNSMEHDLENNDSNQDAELIEELMPEFSYVRDILQKIAGESDGSPWYSTYQPIEQFVFRDEETSLFELDSKALEHQHIFDLANEILQEIYESSIARSTKFTSSDPRIRPVPTGKRLLEQVWAEISWHMNPQQYSANLLDNIVARDFAGNDQWMDLYWDMESLGLLMEDLILDELIEEIID